MPLIAALRQSWEKNWPEVRCALTGGMPAFVLSPRAPVQLPGVPVFCYHLVTRESFERDLQHLQAGGYTTLNADGLADHLSGTRPAPPRTVVLSFDDGPVNFYRVAFPLLQAYRMQAVAFIAPCFHRDTAGSDAAQRTCTWREVREMHDSGLVDVQSHTFSHRYVPRWPEPAALLGADAATIDAQRGQALPLQEDLKRGKDEIEQRLGKAVRHLAFPRYNGSADAIKIGKTVGYEAFWWGVLPGRPLNRPADAPTHIPRLSSEFLRRLPAPHRRPLASILAQRYATNLRRWRQQV